ncbi:hypothetical protein NBRC116493_09180 [Aurantivibrio infirmus]
MNLRLIKASPLLLAAALLSACGGSSGGNNDARVNVAPTIGNIQDQMIQANSPSAPISLALNDDTPTRGLSLTAVADDSGLIGNFIFGSGGGRTLSLDPVDGQLGTSNITVTVTDADGASAQTSFQVIVIEEMAAVSNLVPLIFADNPNANPRDLNTRILVQDSDNTDFFQSLNL